MNDYLILINYTDKIFIKLFLFKCLDGVVKFNYWKYLVEHDESSHIKLCYKLTKDHLYPQHF